ncbi:tetratricopeptide repeat protein [bacterium]|nr:tetratricopeptide repeat protein [bacterium]
MRNRRSYSAFIFIVILLITGCAGNRLLQRPAGPDRPPLRAVTNFITGVFYDLNDNPAAALLAYQEALLYDSTSADIHLAIGMDYLRLGREDAGIRAVKQALRHNPAEHRALEVMAEYYLGKNRMAAADSIFRQMLHYDSTRTDAWFGLAMIAQQKRELEKAKTYYLKCLELDPSYDPRVYDFLGTIYLGEGELEKGEDMYLKSLEVYKDNGLAYNRLGMIGEARGDTAAAIRNYRRAIQEAPGFKEPVERLSRIYTIRGEWKNAAALLHGTIAADSSDIESWLSLGGLYVTTGEIDSAKALYRQVQERFPRDGRADLILGRIHLDEEAYIEAFEAFKQVAAKFPDSPEGWIECGRALLLADSLEASVDYLRRGLAIDSDNFLGNFLAGNALLQLGDNLDAVPYLEKSLESIHDPEQQLPIIGGLANAYDAIGRHEVADSLFQRALDIGPDDSTILNNYSYSLALRKTKLDTALAMALRALEQEPDNGSFLDTVGWIYYLREEYETARTYLERAWQARKTSAEVADHLGDVYWKLEEAEKAVEAWKKALELDPGNSTVRDKLQQRSR